MKKGIVLKIGSRDVLHFEGPPGESLFHQFKKWCLTSDSQKKLQETIVNTLKPIAALNDDRLLVLIGNLLVENAIDEFLSAIIPNYRSLRDKKEVTFFIRIELARALKLCPSILFSCSDLIRKIRNDFVHDLSIDSFDKLPSGRSQSMKHYLYTFAPHSETYTNDADIYRTLILYLTMAISLYTKHILWLNTFIRSEEFMPILRNFCEKKV